MLPVIIASELTARGSDVVSIVHDLRNPLATINVGAEMLAGSVLPRRRSGASALTCIPPGSAYTNCFRSS